MFNSQSHVHTSLLLHYILSPQKKRGNLTTTNKGRRNFMTKRFGSGKFPSIRNIMAGILLNAGPMATPDSVKKSSRIFLFAMSNVKFENAANKLQALGLGSLVFLRGGKTAPVFIKRLPSEVGPILGQEGFEDLCNHEEYSERFACPSPGSITKTMKQTVVSMGLVAPELFVSQELPYFPPAVPDYVEDSVKTEPTYWVTFKAHVGPV